MMGAGAKIHDSMHMQTPRANLHEKFKGMGLQLQGGKGVRELIQRLCPWPKAASYPENAKAKTQQCDWWKDSKQPSCLSFVQLSLIF